MKVTQVDDPGLHAYLSSRRHKISSLATEKQFNNVTTELSMEYGKPLLLHMVFHFAETWSIA